jgi:hypothetical protein
MEDGKCMRRVVKLTRGMNPRVGRILTQFKFAMVNPVATVWVTLLLTSTAIREVSDIRYPSNSAPSSI